MNKTAYLFAIVFLSAALAANLIQHGFWLQMAWEVYTMQSFLSLVTLSNVTVLIALSFVLRYFYFRGWKFVFLFTSIAWILIAVFSIFQYFQIVEVQFHHKTHHIVVILCYRICMTLAGVGILVAAAKNEKALKFTGILMALASLSLLLLFISSMLGRPISFESQISSGIQLFSEIVWLLLIWIFATEIRKQSFPRQYSGLQKNIIVLSGTVSLVLIAFLFGAASQVAREISWSNEWKKKGAAWVESLAIQFDDRIFVSEAGDTLRYFLMKPLNYDSLHRYPVVTCLHGGAVAKGDKIEIPEPAPFLTDGINRNKFPAFIFVPQVIAGRSWGGFPGVRAMDSLVFGALAALQLEFNLDVNRYYIAGGSGGGRGTWEYISRRPDMFAAAIPMCGTGNPANAATIADIPVWAFHGEVDRNVSVSDSRKMIEAIRAAGGRPRYSEFRGIGHNVWPEVQHTPGVFEWLFAQQRND